MTTSLATRPVRFRDTAGRWRALELSLVAQPDGRTWAGRSTGGGLGGGRLGVRAGGEVVRIDTAAGMISVVHPKARDVRARLRGAEARYPGALPGGATLIEQLLTTGVKESVVVPSAASPADYDVALRLPPGVSARAGGPGVELVDRSARVIATVAGGHAFDSATGPSGEGAQTLVTTRLVAAGPGGATLRVGVDPVWLRDPARVFPVTIDPTVYSATSEPGLADAYVDSRFPTTAEGVYDPGVLKVGTWNRGGQVTRSYLRFDTRDLPRSARVSAATVKVYNFYSYSCPTAATPSVGVYGLTSGFHPATLTWRTQPRRDAAPTSATRFARGYSSACPGGWQNLDVTGLARRWAGGLPNHGLVLATSETSNLGWKKFRSGDTGAATAPSLTITWSHPALAAPTALSVHEEATLTPVLRAALPGPAGVRLTGTFRVFDDTAGGALVASGTTGAVSAGATAAFRVPAAALRLGHAYSWTVRSCYVGGPCGPDAAPRRQALPRALSGGAKRAFTERSFGLSERLSLRVNVATGNLRLAASDLDVPTVDGVLLVGRSYNTFS